MTEYAPAPNGAEPMPDYSIDGAALLDDVETFLSRFVVYPGEHERVAHTLWIAHTWFMDRWESTPRIAFLSPEPGSGKSRALEVTEPLVPRPVHAVNTTPSYLFRKVSDPDGAPTILYDEADTVFGPKAKDNEETRAMLNAGHRRGATSGRCVIHGKTIDTIEMPAYCAVALAGLDDLPETVMTRSVIVRMRRRAPTEKVEPWRLRINGPDANELHDRLADWSDQAGADVGWPEMPDGIEDRNADVWEALLAAADLAGGEWPKRARVAAVSVVTRSSDRGSSLGVTLLRDLRVVFGSHEQLPTEKILEGLHALKESPWTDLRGKELDARSLARRLAKYDVKPKVYRDGAGTIRGYQAGDLADPWTRYLPEKRDDDDAQADTVADSTTTVQEIPPIGIWEEGEETEDLVHPPSANGVTSETPQQPTSEEPFPFWNMPRREPGPATPITCARQGCEVTTNGGTYCKQHLDELRAATRRHDEQAAR